MVRRDRHDIFTVILNKARPSKSRTELMSSANMSSAQARQYLGLLMERGPLESGEDHVFETTKKGLNYVEECSECFLCHWHPDTMKSR